MNLKSSCKEINSLHSEFVGGNNRSRTPAVTPVSATYHSLPLTAYSWLSASYSQLGGGTPPSAAFLCICNNKEIEYAQLRDSCKRISKAYSFC